MKNVDRVIGYISLLAILCIIVGVSYGMYRAHHNVIQKMLVDFDELGSLQPEDQVTIRGYTVGTVGQVIWLKDRSRVVIKFNNPIVLREGTVINNVNYALMGQRRIEIIPSKKGKVLTEDHIHTGHFEPGIAESLRYIENVNEQLVAVRDMIHLVAEGDSAHASAPELYEKALSTVENILENTDKTITMVTPKIQEVFDQIEYAGNTLIDVANKTDTAVVTITSAINEKIVQAESIISTLSEGTEKVSQIVAEFEKKPAVEKLITTTETADKLNELVKKFNDLIAAIDTKGIKVLDENGNPVQLVTWKNIHLIGTARGKAKDRAERGESLPE